MNMRIDFYQEVEILSNCKDKNKKYAGKKGVMMGVSEEYGVIYGYAVQLYDEEYLLSFDKNEVAATGKQFKREDFY